MKPQEVKEKLHTEAGKQASALGADVVSALWAAVSSLLRAHASDVGAVFVDNKNAHRNRVKTRFSAGYIFTELLQPTLMFLKMLPLYFFCKLSLEE